MLHISTVTEQDIPAVTRVIDQRHELIDWYRRKGFVPTGKLEPFANASSAALGEFSFMEMRKELV